jgi:hypothetical protein
MLVLNLPIARTAALAHTLGVPAPDIVSLLLHSASGRTLERQQTEIRALLGFREPTVANAEEFGAWLRDYAVALTRDHARPAAQLEEPTPP